MVPDSTCLPGSGSDGQKPFDTLAMEIYPDGNTLVDLYEDDGSTQAYRDGSYSNTLISCEAQNYVSLEDVTVTIGPAEGEYEGNLEERAYWLEVHYPGMPDAVLLNSATLDSASSLVSLNAK